MASYQEFQAKLLERFLSDIVFIELKPGKKMTVGDHTVPDGIPIPVYMFDLANHIKNEDIENIPVVAIIKGLVYYLGADQDVNGYSDSYVSLLEAIDPKMTVSINLDAIKFAENRDYVPAILYFNAVLNIDPHNLDAVYNMGRCYLDLAIAKEIEEMYLMAKQCFESSIKIKSDFAEAHFGLGVCLYNEELYLEAEGAWITALRLELPLEMRDEAIDALGRVRDKALFERGSELIMNHRINEGLEILKALEEDHDDWWNLLFFIGVGYRAQELYEEAISYFLKVLTLNTGHIQTMNEIGICFLSVGDLKAAGKYFKEALRLSPDNAELICNLGIVALNEGDLDEARGRFSKAYELSPHDEVVAMWLSHIHQNFT
ncbi:MAG: tetratricopeptide repeat protein [Clostridia bacterium]|nr:tetratricopeptide repeat protein [Clostridia bacterium]